MTDGIQQISDEELSRWIAEKLEPPPFNGYVVDLTQEATTINPWTKDAGPTYRQSPKSGAWRQRILYNQTNQDVDWNPWQPRDMVNDPAMTLMLLENMPDPMLWRESCTLWGCEPFYRQDGHPVAFNIKLGRAVAEAFALAQGYPETLDRTTKEKAE